MLRISQSLWLLFEIKKALELTTLAFTGLKVYSSENTLFSGKILLFLYPQFYLESGLPTSSRIAEASVDNFR